MQRRRRAESQSIKPDVMECCSFLTHLDTRKALFDKILVANRKEVYLSPSLNCCVVGDTRDPVIMVSASHPAEAACLVNNLSVTGLLRAFNQILGSCLLCSCLLCPCLGICNWTESSRPPEPLERRLSTLDTASSLRTRISRRGWRMR
jgi:hypothetical protein